MKHVVTALIILVIFALAFIFGSVLIENQAHAQHVFTGVAKSNTAGKIFLTIVMTVFASFLSYLTILVRYTK